MLLLGASLPAAARDATADAAADPCPRTTVAPQAEPLLDAGGTRRAPTSGNASRTRPATGAGGEIESPARGPRWHSFLPGMFR